MIDELLNSEDDEVVTRKMSKAKEFRTALKDWVQILALLTAALWAIYTFYIEKFYLPAQTPPSITFNTEFEKVSESAQFELYKVKITIHNKSSVRFALAASWFEIDGYKIVEGDHIKDTAYLNNSEPKSRYSSSFNLDFITWGRVLLENSWINPDQEFTVDDLVTIPQNQFNAVRIYCVAIKTKNKDLRVEWNGKGDVVHMNLFKPHSSVEPLPLDSIVNLAIPKDYKEYEIGRMITINDFPLGVMTKKSERMIAQSH